MASDPRPEQSSFAPSSVQPVGLGAEGLEWFIVCQSLKTFLRLQSELMGGFPWIRKIGSGLTFAGWC